MTDHGTTVVVPSRDRSRLLDATVDSILRQQGGSPRVVVVDDGSRERIIEKPGVRVVRLSESLGAATARNRGLAEVRTPWVAFCDDDDVWAPSKLLAQHAALAANPGVAWSYVGAVAVDENLNVLGAQRARESGWIERSLLRANVVAGGGSSVLARTDLVRTAGGFAEELRVAEDWDLWIRLARLAQVVAVDEPLVAWRRHGGNKSAAWDADALATLDERLRSRARELEMPFEHEYAAQAAIDRAVGAGNRCAAARLYWERFAQRHVLRDAVAATYVLAAPRSFARAKRREHRRSVPAGWEVKLAWLQELAQGWSTGSLAGPENALPGSYHAGL